MEKESFEDKEVAKILNENFISIKVDREERPDIDAVYMDVVQLQTGRGGWPMSVFMDFSARPFYSGTYFPKNSGMYGIGFIPLLKNISEIWKTDRQSLMDAAQEVIQNLKEPNRALEDINYEDVLQRCYRQFEGSFDLRYGGFGKAPKFPSPHNLMFLLRFYSEYKEDKALEMVEKTLVSMYRGGVWDHVGGGFSRYSTDEKWLNPHFEKMLYDNALLAAVYSEAYVITKNSFYRHVAKKIFKYALRDLASPEGAFYSAEDADSEGEEGKFYVFAKEEIISILGQAHGERFCKAYDIKESGNFEGKGKSILNLIENENYKAVIEDDFYKNCLDKILAYRDNRIRPLRDNKILSSWNGLMIYALSYAGRVLENPEYIKKAKMAADFILNKMTDESGRLFTRYCNGEARFSGVADDYAYVIMGLIELYQGCQDVRYLKESYRLSEILISDFYEGGALYQTAKGAEMLISRPRDIYDGALPSYNSVSIINFQKLSHMCSQQHLAEKAEEIISFFSSDIKRAPFYFAFTLCGMMFIKGSCQIVVSGDRSDKLLRAVNKTYQPNTTICCVDEKLADSFEFYKSFINKENKTAAYICRGTACEAPIYDEQEFLDRINLINR